MRKKLIIGGIITLLVLSIIPVVNASEEKPDLIIEDIFLWPSNTPDEYNFECSIKNIGNSTNEWNNLEINVKIKWMFLGSIPLFSIASYTESHYIQGVIKSGETINLSFASCDSLPKFGTYRFSLTVNPNLKIEESDYDNNKYCEDWNVFFGQWKEIG